MLILGIESSCDETAAAVVEDARLVKSSVVASQLLSHEKFGGVIPEIAAREHLRVISASVEQALQDSGVGFDDLDAIAVTQGPGLIGALLVGVNYAKGLSFSLGKPLIPVNHVHAHVQGALLDTSYRDEEIYPCIAAVVSGGHTNIYFMESPVHFKLIGYTTDDACGESFDKVAKLLGMNYPGGPAIEALAQTGDPVQIKMPKMMASSKDLMMSYSGLKTHMVNLVRQLPNPSQQQKSDMCAAFQREALSQLVRKLSLASTLYPEAKSVVIAGGVSANKVFKQLLSEAMNGQQVVFPQLKYCSDNAAMIAAQGYYDFKNQNLPQNYQNLDWEAYAQYPFQDFIQKSQS